MTEACAHVFVHLFGSPVCGQPEYAGVHRIPTPDVLSHRYKEPAPTCSECGGAGKRLSANFDGDPFVPCPACAVPESPTEGGERG